jgi:hypothetical protein
MAAATAVAQVPKGAIRTLQVGGWDVYRGLDRMTDKVTCSAVYRTDPRVQMSDDALYVGMAGGIESITIRFGDQDPRKLRFPTEIERKIGAVMLEWGDFHEFQAFGRIRVQARTIAQGLQFRDVDAAGAREAVAHMKNGCLIAAGVKEIPAESPGRCTPELRARLAAAGVTAEQVRAACDAA